MKAKVEAIFDLREAAEAHARAEVAVERAPTPDKKDRLLDAKLALQEATQDALEACEHCSLPHHASEPCNTIEFPAARDAEPEATT